MNTRGARVAYAKYLEPEIRSRFRLPLRLSQHAHEHRSAGPVLLAVDQKLGEGATLREPKNSPIRSARSKSGSIQDVEKLGAGSGAESVETYPESALELRNPNRASRSRPATLRS
jgi:hypothetical protein